MKSIFVLSILAAVVITGSRAIVTLPRVAVTDTAPPFRSMQFLIGKWDCLGGGLGTPEHSFTNTYSLVLDGRWMRLHSVAAPFGAGRSRAFVSDAYTTFEQDNRRWATIRIDNFGYYLVLTSSGWRGDTITWTEYSSDVAQPHYREVLAKVSNRQIRISIQTLDDSGAATQVGTGNCKKATLDHSLQSLQRFDTQPTSKLAAV